MHGLRTFRADARPGRVFCPCGQRVGTVLGEERAGKTVVGMRSQREQAVRDLREESARNGGRVKSRYIIRVCALYAQAVLGEVGAVQVNCRTVRQPDAEPGLVAGGDGLAEGGAACQGSRNGPRRGARHQSPGERAPGRSRRARRKGELP